jgi:CDP-diacylglycerol--serine O-phosphatidyltransferase
VVADSDRPPPRHVSLRRLVPNFITTAALCCGLAALHYAAKAESSGLNENWSRALFLVTLAAVLDALDGRAARLLRVSSPFGATLDSLADFISFGVAPAFLLYKWQLHDADILGLGACILYALCAALRLARFTAMDKKGKGTPWGPGYFIGMPAPAAAGAVLIPLFLDTSKKLDLTLPVWLVVLHTLLIAGLMISRVPMFSMKKMRIGRRWAVPLMVLFGAIVIAAARDLWLTLACLAFAYLITAPISILRAKRIKRSQAAPAPGPNGAATPVSTRHGN